ncbi:Rhomboid family protein [Pseudobythopirellula maris]|uniref:Rhomboid family protein n=1 Tax=Pseudobythopirellula maris TaxID=2527991 RepID=A0A5C5ZN02_9BACT|nr:rhomboid family intramembrane serine protease [Pseudobythopirellula maris]TWT88357.1 Rhomboid family protein [Pseudobythopirellula maris]
MFFPCSADAPIYHWPYATVGLIVANVAVFVGMVTGELTPAGPWVLMYGDGLHPAQWVGAHFSHAGPGHLLYNMAFLWVFGLIVEGKLGWWKFLSLYLGICIIEGAIEQLVMLPFGAVGTGSLGASSAIYGVMAIAIVWAPANEISFFYFFWFYFRFIVGTFEVPVAMVAAFYVGLDMLLAMLGGAGAASSLLHLAGAAVGFPIGVAMLHWKLVDCEGWDLFHYQNRVDENDPKQVQKKLKALDKRKKKKDDAQLAGALEQWRLYLKNGAPLAALTLCRKMQEVGQGLELGVDDLRALVRGLHAEKHWGDSAPYMARLIELDPEHAPALRLKLAQICVVELSRPGRALELLSQVDDARLTLDQRGLKARIAHRAAELQGEGTVELDDGAWQSLAPS